MRAGTALIPGSVALPSLVGQADVTTSRFCWGVEAEVDFRFNQGETYFHFHRRENP